MKPLEIRPYCFEEDSDGSCKKREEENPPCQHCIHKTKDERKPLDLDLGHPENRRMPGGRPRNI